MGSALPRSFPVVSSSAPGKIILFGEHAVVYGRPALAAPVTQVQATATVSAGGLKDHRTGMAGAIWIDAADVGLQSELSRLAADHPLAAVTRSVFSALGIPYDPPPFSAGMTIHVTSTISVASGLGSGAAVSVALIRALSEFLGRSLPDERVSALAYEVEKLYHGTPSGIDNTVVTYARPVYFAKGRPMEMLRVGEPFTVVIGDTGLAAPTKESVGDVRKLWQAAKARYESLFDRISEIVDRARVKIEEGDWAALGPLMDENHALLQQLTVSCPELDRLTEAARKSGALGAKLSGGGRGGSMVALVRKEDAPAVAEALSAAGAKRTIVTQID